MGVEADRFFDKFFGEAKVFGKLPKLCRLLFVQAYLLLAKADRLKEIFSKINNSFRLRHGEFLWVDCNIVCADLSTIRNKKQRGGKNMNYEELIAKMLKQATQEELERIYYFLLGYIKGKNK